MNRFYSALACLLFFTGCAGKPSAPVNTEDQKLTAVIQKYSAAAKRIDAYSAAYFNVEEDLEKFGDALSPEIRERSLTLTKNSMDELNQVQPQKLSPAQNVAYQLFKSDLEKSLEDFKFRMEYFSYNQMDNRLHSYLDDSNPDLTSFPFDSAVHYRAFIKRSEGFPAFVDRQIETMKKGAKAGYALNCTLAKASISTYKPGLEATIEKNPFYRPVLKMPATISKADQTQIADGFRSMIQDRILPGYKKFDAFMQNEYPKLCQQKYGLASVPEGKALYENSMWHGTDLKLDPVAVHQMGLNEVARIRKEMDAAFKQIGYKGSLKSSLKKLLADKDSFFTDKKMMLAAYDEYRAKVAAAIPTGFSLQPKAEVKIVEGENPEDASGRYSDPTDFLPYGRFIFNGSDLKATPKWGIYTLFLHEAIPGHHFQLALMYEMKDQLSEYQRKLFWSIAFCEGWALYAERWGREAGLVSEPKALIGSLSDEMLRAVRLVVDTGIHHDGWSREKAIQYMSENLAMDKRQIQIEADRYSVWPGQALGYKIGQLKILELRELAKKELGTKFDIKEFHRAVIGGGTVSLPILESNVKKWIASVSH